MSEALDLFKMRFTQITFALMFFAYLTEYWHIPHSSWIIITSAFIYAGFDPATTIKRAYMRFFGTITGIAAVAIIWQLTHLDYRLLIFFIVILSWALVFFINAPYSQFMILSTLFSDLAIEISNSSSFPLQFYVLDRFFSTAIVFGFCILIERLWFGRSNLTLLNCRFLLCTIHNDLNEFYSMMTSKKITRAVLFKKLRQVNKKIQRLKELLNSQHYAAHNTPFYHHIDNLANKITHDFRKIVCFLYLQVNNSTHPSIPILKSEIEAHLISAPDTPSHFLS